MNTLHSYATKRHMSSGLAVNCDIQREPDRVMCLCTRRSVYGDPAEGDAEGHAGGAEAALRDGRLLHTLQHPARPPGQPALLTCQTVRVRLAAAG